MLIHLSQSSFQYDGDHLASTGTTWQNQLHLLRPRAAHRLKPRLLPLLAKLLNSSPRRAGVHLVEKQLHLFGPRAPICTLGLHLGLHLAEVTPTFWEKSHLGLHLVPSGSTWGSTWQKQIHQGLHLAPSGSSLPQTHSCFRSLNSSIFHQQSVLARP